MKHPESRRVHDQLMQCRKWVPRLQRRVIPFTIIKFVKKLKVDPNAWSKFFEIEFLVLCNRVESEKLTHVRESVQFDPVYPKIQLQKPRPSVRDSLEYMITCWWTGMSRPSTFWPFCSMTLIITKNMLIASSNSGEVTTAYNNRQNVNTYKNKCSVFYAEKLVPCSWRDRLQYFWELFSSALEVIRAFWAGPRP